MIRLGNAMMKTVAVLRLCLVAGMMLGGSALPTLAQEASTGDQEHGRKLFWACFACHRNFEGADSVSGPNLAGFYGQQAGARVDYGRYSDAMKDSGLIWTDQVLDAWLADPNVFLPNSKMVYPGMPNAQDRADLIAYLKTLKAP